MALGMSRAVSNSSSLENRIKHKELSKLNGENHHGHFSKFTQHVPQEQQITILIYS